MTTDLTSITILHNAERIRYPWRQAILSILPVVDEAIVVLAGPHEDDTINRVIEFVQDKPTIRVVVSEKDKKKVEEQLPFTFAVSPNQVFQYQYDSRVQWPETHIGLSSLVNIGVEYASTKIVFQVQADEIFSGDDHLELKHLPNMLDNYMAASFGFRHFCGDFHHVFPFVYERVVRAYRTDSDFLFAGDAVQASGYGDVYSANVTVNHVGKVHVGREEAAAFKEYFFQKQLYSDGKCWAGDVDPKVRAAYEKGKLDFFEVFGETVKRGDVKEYSGPWCKYVREWAHELGVEL